MDDDGGLTAELAAINERREVGITGVVPGMIGPVDPVEQCRALAQLADVDVPRLVAALEAVLALADKYDAESKRLWTRVREGDRRGIKTGTASIDAAWNGDAAKAIREAAASALTGTEGGR